MHHNYCKITDEGISGELSHYWWEHCQKCLFLNHCFCWNVTLLHRLIGLNTGSTAGGNLWEVCWTFTSWILERKSTSPGLGLVVLQLSCNWILPVLWFQNVTAVTSRCLMQCSPCTLSLENCKQKKPYFLKVGFSQSCLAKQQYK